MKASGQSILLAFGKGKPKPSYEEDETEEDVESEDDDMVERKRVAASEVRAALGLPEAKSEDDDSALADALEAFMRCCDD